MRIIFQVDDFLYTLFPDISSENQLIQRLAEYYTVGSSRPNVTISDGWAVIEFDSTPPQCTRSI